MDDIKRQAARHIERVDKLRRQLAEVEEMLEALESNVGKDIQIGVWNKTGHMYGVWLERDLGITAAQEEIRIKVLTETYIRKEVIKMTLTQLIGGDTK